MEKHGDRIKRLRLARDLTQVQLAEAAGVDQSTLSGIEKHNAMPAADTLIRLAEALGSPAEYLMRGVSPQWPFRSVSLARFMALSTEDRAYVEGRLEAAIEVKETSQTERQQPQPQQQTDPAVTGTTGAPVRKRSDFLDRLPVGGKRASGEFDGIPQQRRNRGPKRAA